jgi:hypothetical protein
MARTPDGKQRRSVEMTELGVRTEATGFAQASGNLRIGLLRRQAVQFENLLETAVVNSRQCANPMNAGHYVLLLEFVHSAGRYHEGSLSESASEFQTELVNIPES